MKIKNTKYLKISFYLISFFIFLLGILMTVFSFIPQFRGLISEYITVNSVFLPLIIVVFKILAIVFPPIAGGWLSYLSIIYIGWFYAAILDSIGSLIGCVIAFVLARKYKQKFVSKFVSLKNLQIIENKLSSKQKFWTFLYIRLSTGPIYDYINYLVALTDIKFSTYLTVSTIAFLPNFLYFYLASLGFEISPLFFIVFFIPLIILYFIYKREWKNTEFTNPSEGK